MVVGLYVGLTYWYLLYDWAGDQHTLITFEQFSNFGICDNNTLSDIFSYDNFHPSSDFCDTTKWGYLIDGGRCVEHMNVDPYYYIHIGKAVTSTLYVCVTNFLYLCLCVL